MARENDEEVSDLVVLMRVLDIIERRIETRDAKNYESIQITRVANQFLSGSSIGSLFQTNNGEGEVVMGDKFVAQGQARVGNMGNKAKIGTVSFGGPSEDIDLGVLAQELKELRAAMRQQASSTEEDQAVVAVGQAVATAEGGDASSTVDHLRTAGNWALGIATTIGGGVAVAALKAALGL